jgi:hypothetical protein
MANAKADNFEAMTIIGVIQAQRHGKKPTEKTARICRGPPKQLALSRSLGYDK